MDLAHFQWSMRIKGSCTPSMVNVDFLVLPHNDRLRQTSWLFHWMTRKKKSCTPSMVNEGKFFRLTEEWETCLSEWTSRGGSYSIYNLHHVPCCV